MKNNNNKTLFFWILFISLVQNLNGMDKDFSDKEEQKDESIESYSTDALAFIKKEILKQNISKEDFEKLQLSKDFIKKLKQTARNYRDKLNRNLLFKAKTVNNVKVLKYLGADCQTEDIFGNTLLNWATQNARDDAMILEIIRHLEDDYPNNYGQSAFHNLIITGNTYLADLMLQDEMVVLDFANISDFCSHPLFIAARYDAEMLKKLIKKKYTENIDIISSNGYTTLILACRFQPEAAKILLSAGANVNAQSKEGITPLMVAAVYQTDLLQLLLDHGAKDLRDLEGRNALMHAILRKRIVPGTVDNQKNLEAIKILINPNSVKNKDMHGITPLMLAVQFIPEAIELLLNGGAPINQVDTSGKTVLMHLVSNDHSICELSKSIELLINAGADINSTDKKGKTTLMIAARYNPQIIEQLVKRGAQIDAVDNKGWSALMYAAKCNPECVEVLVKLGANINLRNKKGKTALQIAEDANPDKKRSIEILLKEKVSKIKDSLATSSKKRKREKEE